VLKVFRTLLVFLASLLLFNAPSSAQQTLGAINGTVTDSSGAVVARATVKVLNVATGLNQTVSFAYGKVPLLLQQRAHRQASPLRAEG
jgi:hypothetical protein